MFTFDTLSDAITGQFPLEQIFPNTTNPRILFINPEQEEDDSDMDPEMREFYFAAMTGATSGRFLPDHHHNNRVKRQYGGHGCSNSLGIFNFLLFLVVLAGLLATLLNNAMINIMLNGQNVSLFQVIKTNIFLDSFSEFFLRPSYLHSLAYVEMWSTTMSTITIITTTTIIIITTTTIIMSI